MSQEITTGQEEKRELRGKSDLIAYNAILRRIDALERRIEDFKETMYSPATSKWSDVPVTHNRTGISKQERVVTRLEQMEERLADLVEKEAAQYERVTAALSRLDPDDDYILSLRYVDRMRWDKITEILYGDEEDYDDNPEKYQKRAFRVHGRALESLEAIYDEIYPLKDKTAPAPEE